MTETMQRSIFDYGDRILPKEKRTIAMTDYDGNMVRVMPDDAEAMVSAIEGRIITKGTWPRFMTERRRYDHDGMGLSSDSYISYWLMHEPFHCHIDYVTGEVYDCTIFVCKPNYVNGKEVGTTRRTPTSATIEGDTLVFVCDDGNTYTAIIDGQAIRSRSEIHPFSPTTDREHLLLYLYTQGARGDELIPVMSYGPCYLKGLSGHNQLDCEIQDLAGRYGLELRMPSTVEQWAPKHYPNQATCKNCSRFHKKEGTCQVGSQHPGDSCICCFKWHWNGTPFKKVKKKEPEEEDDMEGDE